MSENPCPYRDGSYRAMAWWRGRDHGYGEGRDAGKHAAYAQALKDVEAAQTALALADVLPHFAVMRGIGPLAASRELLAAAVRAVREENQR